jgi:hypothetical protein
VDLNYLEDSGGGPDLSVALHPLTGRMVLMQMDGRWVDVVGGTMGGGRDKGET